jgi:hypothetical protein
MRKKTTKKRKPSTRKSVNKPFADNTMSSSAFFSMIRSALRNQSRFFYSMKACRDRTKIPYTGINKRKKWWYTCETCHVPYDIKKMNVHHIEGCGKLTSFEDIPEFCKKLFCSSDKLLHLCENCHKSIHENNIKDETSK